MARIHAYVPVQRISEQLPRDAERRELFKVIPGNIAQQHRSRRPGALEIEKERYYLVNLQSNRLTLSLQALQKLGKRSGMRKNQQDALPLVNYVCSYQVTWAKRGGSNRSRGEVHHCLAIAYHARPYVYVILLLFPTSESRRQRRLFVHGSCGSLKG